MKITLKQLRVFALTAKHGNISLAAQEIAISQAAASMSLSQLESMLNQSLFRREGKKLIINNIGKKILPKANAILESVTNLELSVSKQNQFSGSLHIGASTTIANTILPKLLNKFLKKFPDIDIVVTVGNTESCIKKLLNYQIDIALVEGLNLTPDVDFEPWLTDQLSVFCHPENLLTQKKTIKPKDLERCPWVLRESTSGTRQAFEAALLSSPINLEKIIIINSSIAIKNFIRENKAALGCLSNNVIEDDVKNKKLISLKIKSWDLSRNFYHVKHKAKSYSELCQLFMKEIGLNP